MAGWTCFFETMHLLIPSQIMTYWALGSSASRAGASAEASLFMLTEKESRDGKAFKRAVSSGASVHPI